MSNVIVSGLAALFISWFFAEGAIGDADSLTPQFFLILPIWAIGVLLMWRVMSKGKSGNGSRSKMILSNIMIWLTIPIGLMLAFQFI